MTEVSLALWTFLKGLFLAIFRLIKDWYLPVPKILFSNVAFYTISGRISVWPPFCSDSTGSWKKYCEIFSFSTIVQNGQILLKSRLEKYCEIVSFILTLQNGQILRKRQKWIRIILSHESFIAGLFKKNNEYCFKKCLTTHSYSPISPFLLASVVHSLLYFYACSSPVQKRHLLQLGQLCNLPWKEKEESSLSSFVWWIKSFTFLSNLIFFLTYESHEKKAKTWLSFSESWQTFRVNWWDTFTKKETHRLLQC